MRQSAGAIICGALAVVLVVAAALVKWSVAPALVKAPLSIHSVTISNGTAQVFVLAKQAVATVPIVATRTVTGDEKAGTGSVAVYDEVLCLRAAAATDADGDGCVAASDPAFVEKTTDRVAFDRTSALPAADDQVRFGAAVDGKPVTHTGLGYTFPIDTRKQTYPFFDTVVNESFPMTYQDTESVGGLSVYRFVQDVPDSKIQISGLLPGTYANVRTVWVEPTTGVIIKGSEQITEKFSTGGIAFQGTLTFTDSTVRSQAKFANDQLGKIHLIRLWIPLLLLVIGVIDGVFAVLFVVRARRRGRGQAPVADPASFAQT